MQAAEACESVDELKSRVRELETEQRLIQRELDSVTEAAQRAESQLRSATSFQMFDDVLIQPHENLKSFSDKLMANLFTAR